MQPNWVPSRLYESESMKNEVVGDHNLNRCHLLSLCQGQGSPKYLISSTRYASALRLVSEVLRMAQRGEATGIHPGRHTALSPCLHISAPLSSDMDTKTALHTNASIWGWDHYILRDKFGVENSLFTKPLFTAFGEPAILIYAAIRHFNSQHWKGNAIKAQECWKSPEFPLTRSPRWFSGLSLLRDWKGGGDLCLGKT